MKEAQAAQQAVTIAAAGAGASSAGIAAASVSATAGAAGCYFLIGGLPNSQETFIMVSL